MSIVTALLSTARRPSDEARRVVEGIASGIDPHSDSLPSEHSAAALAATDAVIQQIADEKAPRPAAAPSGHADEFSDSETRTSAFEDPEPALMPALRSDSRFSIDHGEDEDPPLSDTAHTSADQRPPWDDAGFSAPPPAPEQPAELGAEESTPETDEADQIEHPRLLEVGDDIPAAQDGYEYDEYADEDAHPGGADDEPDEPEVPDEDAAESAHIQPPSLTDAYAGAGSPWGDAQEIVAIPEQDSDDDEPADGDFDGPAPSLMATDPPTDLAEPAPEPEPSPMQRLREWLDRTLANKHNKIRLIAAGAAVVAVVAVLAVLSLGGGRGKPPEPIGIAEPPPAQFDNAHPARTDAPLIPSTVSASCGNDSDPVAPFASQKTRAWVCKRVNGLDLNVLNITFDKPMVITSITIVPGFNYVAPDGRDEWARHRLVTGVTWRMGGAVYPQEITPTRTGVTKQFPSVITQEMSMTVTGSTRPPMGGAGLKGGGIAGAGDADDPSKIDEHTAVSSITITGHPVDPGGN